ncbi:hypothetical protein BJ508DRAFT_330850 [Ascobolus immersus RN42]|uniref:Uncharacterized protein n=1 Tax=Ascobolus immersus RN42 TaxID=1160509 RepID=A0A3N4HXK4_ASCIM|nr:hypothetical protein BJ508DRAFT_330850 [Ascobolus immersus RN42]
MSHSPSPFRHLHLSRRRNTFIPIAPTLLCYRSVTVVLTAPTLVFPPFRHWRTTAPALGLTARTLAFTLPAIVFTAPTLAFPPLLHSVSPLRHLPSLSRTCIHCVDTGVPTAPTLVLANTHRPDIRHRS